MGQKRLYEVRLSSHAQRDLDNLSNDEWLRLDGRIQSLADQPRPHRVEKLVDTDKGYRLRVGDWRVIYVIDDAQHIVVVHHVRRRGEDTYRNLRL